MAAVWSVVWGMLFIGQPKVALVAGLASFSHFVADSPMHNADLAIYPFAEDHLGYGLWGKLGAVSWVLEGLFAALLCAYAWWIERKRGVNITLLCVLLAVVFVNLSPWLSPMKLVATFQEPAAHLVHGLLVTVGFLLPGAGLVWLWGRAERKANLA